MTVMEEETYTCFFYGTLMAYEVLKRVISSTQSPEPYHITIRPAVIYDYCRHKVRGVDYPAVRYRPNSHVRGTIVEGLSAEDMRKLDFFEGDEYKRCIVDAHIVNQGESWEYVLPETVYANIYMWDKAQELLEPEEWSYAEFKRSKLAQWVSDPKNFESEGGLLKCRECFSTDTKVAAANPVKSPKVAAPAKRLVHENAITISPISNRHWTAPALIASPSS